MLFKVGGGLLLLVLVAVVVLELLSPLILKGVFDVADVRASQRFEASCKAFCPHGLVNQSVLYVYGSASFHLWECRCKVSPQTAYGFVDLGTVKDNLDTFRITLDYSNCTENGWRCARVEN
jgi:hypothetical protein